MDIDAPWQQGIIAGLAWIIIWTLLGTALGGDLLSEAIQGTAGGIGYAIVYTYLQHRKNSKRS